MTVDYIEKGFGMRRNLDYIYEKLKILIKSLLEYKFNFFNVLGMQIMWYITQVFFMIIFFSQFISTINWTIGDFFLFFSISNFIHVLSGTIFWRSRLYNLIARGDLNPLLTKPLNPLFQYYFFYFPMFMIIFTITNLLFIFGSILYFNVVIENLFLFLIYFFLIAISAIFFAIFIDSTNYIKLGLGEKLLDIVELTSMTTRNYPGQFFTNFSFNFIFFIFSGYLTSMILLPLSQGEYINNIYLLYLILFIIFLFVSMNYLWHYGLKKYEAFG